MSTLAWTKLKLELVVRMFILVLIATFIAQDMYIILFSHGNEGFILHFSTGMVQSHSQLAR